MKLLDCTLRDGGYYTNWDFDYELIREYATTMQNLPIDYIEVGYRSIPLKGYLGKYYYCPVFVLDELKKLMPSKKLVIILNEKDIREEHVRELLLPIKPFVTLIRIAVDPQNFERAVNLAKAVKSMGFELAFNVMYMSNWKNDPSFLNIAGKLDSILDFFYMVDSFGGILPNEVKEIIKLVKSKTKVPIGFHGHDNLHMGLINTITALDEGCAIVDSTITGMGRGAGNLQTELLLTYLESKNSIEFNFNKLASLVSRFDTLKKKYQWGTNLPYMFSGAYSLPQKDVMEWLGMNRYSLSSILNALNNQKLVQKDNIELPFYKIEKDYGKVIILGGGKSVDINKKAIEKLLVSDDDIALIYAGARNVQKFPNLKNDKFVSLVGVESEESLRGIQCPNDLIVAVYGPYPRKMGTFVPGELMETSFELDSISFTSASNDSPFAIAAQLAINLGVKELFLIGFDGYDTEINKKRSILEKENQKIINDLGNTRLKLVSLTPTKYVNLNVTSIYSHLT